MALLEAENISIEFGGLKAVQDFNLHLNEQELYAIIGPNGAGKTTAFNMLTGIYTPTSGIVRMDGEVMNGKKAYQFTRKGIARTFQNIRLFGAASVLENLTIAMGGGRALYARGYASAHTALPQTGRRICGARKGASGVL